MPGVKIFCTYGEGTAANQDVLLHWRVYKVTRLGCRLRIPSEDFGSGRPMNLGEETREQLVSLSRNVRITDRIVFESL